MTLDSYSFRRSVQLGAVHGAVAWLVYAAVEYGAETMVARVARDHCGASGYGLQHAAEIFLTRPVLGLLAGAVGGALIWALGHAWHRVGRAAGPPVFYGLAALTVAWLGLAPAASHIGWKPSGLVLALTVLGSTLAFVSVLWSRPLGRSLAPLESPWGLSLILQAMIWLRMHQVLVGETPVVRYVLTAGSVAVIWAGSILMARLARRSVARGSARVPEQAPWGAQALAALTILVLGLALNFAPLPIAGASQTASAAGRPNVVLIVLDAVRADHLSAYGYSRDTTPNLRAFAGQATLYTRAMSASNYTMPSTVSLLTGLYPSANGAHWNLSDEEGEVSGAGHVLGPKVVTLAELLSANGYFSAALIANHGFLAPRFHLNRGFQYYGVPYPGCRPPFVLDSLWGPESAAGSDARFIDAATINSQITWLVDRIRRPQPFFLFVNFMDGHWPYTPPAPFHLRFQGHETQVDPDDYLALRQGVLKGERTLTPDVQQYWISQYDAGIAYLDDQLGRLFQHLRERGSYDDSLIIITADHGDAFGEHSMLGHGASLYHHQVHVPLIVKYPGSKVGRVVRDPVSAVDIVPTVLQAARLPTVAGLQGTSLTDPIRQQPVLSESFPRRGLVGLGSRFHRIDRAIFKGPHKLIASTTGTLEAYNLDADPSETHNIYSADDPLFQQLNAELQEWIRAQPDAADNAPGVDPETLERLKALGYVQ